jgi:GrpB-like predicted nucleotidyltransferase (UPF0157 family)
MIMNKHKAREYENLKLELAGNYANDPESYSKGKTAFIKLIDKEIVENDFKTQIEHRENELG